VTRRIEEVGGEHRTPAELDRLEITVVGVPSVRLRGEPVTFLTRHAELAVYLLALAGPGGILADDLGEMLWPSAPPARRRPRLRTLLWQVRTALGTHGWRVRRSDSTIVLHPDGAGLDLAAGGGDGERLLEGWDVRPLVARVLEQRQPSSG
jgi:DNA-binding SARP family transcriptional activator